MSDRTDALELADQCAAWMSRGHGGTICEVAAEQLLSKAEAALRVAPQPAGLPCERCGSSGDIFVLCAGCHSPTTEEAMFMLQDVPGATLVERVARLSKWYLELKTASQPETAGVRENWHLGAPAKPWSSEWFIAETIFGDRVILTELPDEYTYDFKTADDTYIKRDKIKRWMQFPDSQFVPADTRPYADRAPTDDQITAGAAWLAESVLRMKWTGLRKNGRAAEAGYNPWQYHNARQEDYRDAVRGILAAMESAKPDESYADRADSATAFDPELQADGDAEKLILDQRRLDWLQERVVDTIYLDDGKIIDVRGGNLRDAVDGAMKPAPDAEKNLRMANELERRLKAPQADPPEGQGDDRLGEQGND